jgi:hypothetical protein
MKTNCRLDVEIKERIFHCEILCDYLPRYAGDYMNPPDDPSIDITQIIVESIELFDDEIILASWLKGHGLYDLAEGAVYEQLNHSASDWYNLCEAVEDSLND